MVNRLCRYGSLLALLVALLSPSARAQAPQRERIALHPCVITGGTSKTPTEELENACAVSAVRESVDFVPSTEVVNFLKEESCAKTKDRAACMEQLNAPKKAPQTRATRPSCANSKNRDACLGRLAAATKADHTLYITIDVKEVPAVKKGKTKSPATTRVTRITGIVVDPRGKKVEERSQESSANDPPNEAIRFGVTYILDRLEVTKPPPPEITPLPLGPSAETTPPPPSGPTYSPTPTPPEPVATPGPGGGSTLPPEAVKQEAPGGRTWKTTAGIASGVLGAAGIVAGIIIGSSGNAKAKEFNDAFTGGLPESGELGGLDQLRKDAESQQKTGTIAGVAGGALLVTGGVLWFLDRPSATEGKAGTATLLVSPSQVGVRVLLP